MPEGNELHRFAAMQRAMFEGKKVTVDAPNGRFEDGAALLTGRVLKSVEAFGKHLFYEFGPDRQLHVHLGLFGKFRDGEGACPEPKGALRLRISTPEHWIELRGPTACDVLSGEARAKLLARIGPDPLRDDADALTAIRRIRKSRSPLGALLMDQAVISGIGNIFRAELLFRAGLSPFRAGSTATGPALRKLWRDAQELMQAGMKDRRIVTTRPAERPHPKGRARRGETHYVYKREGLPCFLCGTAIMAKAFGGRRVFWCPGCQPDGSAPGGRKAAPSGRQSI